MQLIEYIKRLNTKILFKYLLDNDEKIHFSEALYQELYQKLTSKEFFQLQIDRFDEEEVDVLFSIYLSGIRGIRFDDTSLKAKLLRSFFVYEKTVDEENYLCGFEEYNQLFAAYFSDLYSYSADGVPAVAPFDVAYQTDLAVLFSFLCSGRSVLKQTGYVTKQFQDSFLTVTHLGTLVSSLTLKDREVELLFSFVFDALAQCGVVEIEGNVIRVSTEVETNLAELLKEIKDNLLSHLQVLGSNLQFIKEIATVSDGFTIERRFFAGELLPFVTLFCWLGEIDLIYSDSEISIKSTTVPHLETHYPSGHMMPDFTVMIPREIEPVSLYEFLKIGTLDSLDMIYRGSVSREHIVDSVAGSFDEDGVLSILEKWNGAPNLFSTVKDWIHGFNKLFIDGSYLAVKGSDADAISSLPEVQPFISEVTGYRFFRIASGREEYLDLVLKKKNFDTRYPESYEHSHLFERGLEFASEFTEDINFEPQMESLSTPRTPMGIYSSQLKSLSVGDISKLVKYATLMDYKLMLHYENEFGEIEECLITPINLAGGKDSFIEASDSDGTVRKFLLDRIDKIGVLSDDC